MKYYVLNHKNKMTYDEALKFSEAVLDLDLSNSKLIIVPSALYLPLFTGVHYYLGSQDISSFEEKTVTGEITGKQLKSLGVNYVIIGHSERREYCNETDYSLITKINNAIINDLKVIYCVGETLEERKLNKTFYKLEKQIARVFNKIKSAEIIIAYEPIWAIGTGLTPDMNQIQEVSSFIKKLVKDYYGKKAIVLYGGSVNETNIESLKAVENVDGFLIGGASVDVQKVAKIIK